MNKIKIKLCDYCSSKYINNCSKINLILSNVLIRNSNKSYY